MNALKPEIITLFKHRQQLAKWLRDHGKAKEEINNLLENWSVEERQGPSGRHHSFSSSISPGNMGIFQPDSGINISHENQIFSGMDSKISKLFRICKKNLKTDYCRFLSLS